MSYHLSPYLYNQLVKCANEDVLREKIKKKEATYVKKLNAIFSAITENSGKIPVQEECVNALIETMARLELFKPGVYFFEFANLVERLSRIAKDTWVTKIRNPIFSSFLEKIPRKEKLPLERLDCLVAQLISKGAHLTSEEIELFKQNGLKKSLVVACEVANTPEVRNAIFSAAWDLGNPEFIERAFSKAPSLHDKTVVAAIFNASVYYPQTIFPYINEGKISLEINYNGGNLKKHILNWGNPLLTLAVLLKAKEVPDDLFKDFAADEAPDLSAHLAVKEWMKRVRFERFDQNAFKKVIQNLAKIGSSEGIQWVLDKLPPSLKGKRDELLNGKDEEGHTPLSLACDGRMGSEAALFLLKQGVNFKEKDEDGVLPIHYALAAGHFSVVKEIFSKMAPEERKEFLEVKTEMYSEPIVEAIEGGDSQIVAFLLSEKAGLESWLKLTKKSIVISSLMTDSKKEAQYRLIVDHLLNSKEALLPLLFHAIEFSQLLSGSSDKQQYLCLIAFVKEMFKRFSSEDLKKILNEKRCGYTPFETALMSRSLLIEVIMDHGAEVKGVAPLLGDLLQYKFPVLKRVIALSSEAERNQCLSFETFNKIVSSRADYISKWMRLYIKFKSEAELADQLLFQLQNNQIKDFPLLLKAVDEVLLHEKGRIFKQMLSQKEWFKNGADLTPLLLNQLGDHALILMHPKGVRQVTVFKEIMAEKSPYFKVRFFGPFSKESESLIPLGSQKEADLFEKVILYFYSQKIKIKHENFSSLASFANQYEILPLREMLGEWIQHHPECSHWNEKYLNPPSKRKADDDLYEKEKKGKLD